jgi:hypothetical protein
MGAQHPLGPVNPVITSFILLAAWRFLYLVLTPIIPFYVDTPGPSNTPQSSDNRTGQLEYTRLEGNMTRIKWLSSNYEKIFRNDDPLVKDLIEMIVKTGQITGVISTGLSIDGPEMGETGWTEWFWLVW